MKKFIAYKGFVIPLMAGVILIAVLALFMFKGGSGDDPASPAPTQDSELGMTDESEESPEDDGPDAVVVPEVIPDPEPEPPPVAENPHGQAELHVGIDPNPSPQKGGGKAEKIMLNKNKITVTKGNSYKFRITFAPETARQEVTWRSDNESVAMVSEDGMLTGLEEGRASITAQTPDGVADTCAVTIQNPRERVPGRA